MKLVHMYKHYFRAPLSVPACANPGNTSRDPIPNRFVENLVVAVSYHFFFSSVRSLLFVKDQERQKLGKQLGKWEILRPC